MAKDGKKYENLGVQVYKILAKKLEETNVEIEGPRAFLESPYGEREFDVVLRHKLMGHSYVTAVECRDKSRKIGSPQMEAFIKKVELVRANKGVFFSRKGFYKPALNMAKDHGIDTFVVVDSDSDFQTIKEHLVKVPVVVEIIDQIVLIPNFQFDGIGIPLDIQNDAIMRPGNIDVYEMFRRELAKGNLELKVSSSPNLWVPDLSAEQLFLATKQGINLPIRNYQWHYKIGKISRYLGYAHDLPNTMLRSNCVAPEKELFLCENDIEDKSYLESFEKLPDEYELPRGFKIRCVNAPNLNQGPSLLRRID